MSQQGSIYKKNGAWFGKWRQDEIVDGQVVRKQRHRKLAEINDRYRTQKDVRPLLNDILRPINSGKFDPRGTMPLAEYIERVYLPKAQQSLKPSTFYGYSHIYKKYLAPRLDGAALRDFTTSDARNLLHEIHRQTGIGKKHLRHIKSFLESAFDLALSDGVVEANPLRIRTNNKVVELIPQDAALSINTGHSTREDVLRMLALDTLSLKARAAIALMFFAGLRPGEARGLRWEDYDGKRLHVRRSIWRKHITTPKTEGSAKAVPVCETLRAVLNQLRQAEGSPEDAPILRGQVSGQPISLDNLAWREVRPALREAGIPWSGWYGLRRGIATTLKEVKGVDAASTMLRHSDVRTTTEHYIKADQEKKERELAEGLALIDELCSRPASAMVQ